MHPNQTVRDQFPVSCRVRVIDMPRGVSHRSGEVWVGVLGTVTVVQCRGAGRWDLQVMPDADSSVSDFWIAGGVWFTPEQLERV